MDRFVVALILGSTFMHAGWNLLARRQRCETSFFERMLLVTVLAGLVPAAMSEAAMSEAATRSLTPIAWACVVGSWLCCGMYYFFLARAYESADFTVVYPVARSLPVVLVALGDMVRGRYPSPAGWSGMLLVVSGCFLVSLRSSRDVNVRRYLDRAHLWMLFTALGTVGYTLLDKVAAETMQQGPTTAARYGYVFFLVSYLAFSVLLRVLGRGEQRPASIGWRDPAIAAALNFGAYWLVLWAYQLSTFASYIVALRQFSIVIGVVLALAIFKEKEPGIRLAGTLVITVGLVVVSLFSG